MHLVMMFQMFTRICRSPAIIQQNIHGCKQSSRPIFSVCFTPEPCDILFWCRLLCRSEVVIQVIFHMTCRISSMPENKSAASMTQPRKSWSLMNIFCQTLLTYMYSVSQMFLRLVLLGFHRANEEAKTHKLEYLKQHAARQMRNLDSHPGSLF